MKAIYLILLQVVFVATAFAQATKVITSSGVLNAGSLTEPVTIKFCNRTYPDTRFVVTPLNTQMILGNDLMHEHGINLDMVHRLPIFATKSPPASISYVMDAPAVEAVLDNYK